MKILIGLLAFGACLQATAAEPATSLSGHVAESRAAVLDNNLDAAIAQLEDLDSSEDNWEVQFWLGTAYLLSGRLDHAADTLDAALAIESDVAEIWVQRAIVEQERDQHGVALQLLEVAAQVDPDYPLTYLNAGIVYEARGDMERARSAYGRFLKLSAGQPGSNRSRRMRRDVLVRISAAGNS